MTEFKSIEILKYPRPGEKVTEDNLHWKKLGFPYAFKEYGAIDYVDFNPKLPSSVAISCSSKVQLYNTTNNEPQSTFSRFKKTAYGGNFRRDGKLLVAGSEDGFLRLFQVETSRLLRMFKGHKAPTHRCSFTIDGVHLVSFSDDKTVALWDIPTETKIKSFEEHKDYIRAGTVSQLSQDLFISGSYDHTVKVYDARAGVCTLSVDHGAPVESVLMFSAGGLFVSAGGTSVNVWDPVAGRKVTEIVQHHKTITSLCFNSDGKRLLSGSLDRHVKIYDVTSYEVVHTLDYPSPILSIAVSPEEDKVVAIGMADGLFSLRHRKADKEPVVKKPTLHHKVIRSADFKPADGDIVIPNEVKAILKKYENRLRKFEASKALDIVLKDRIQKQNPEVTVGVMKELLIRGSLKAAMAEREGESLQQLMKFVNKYFRDVRFQTFLIDVSMMLMDIYGPKMCDPEVNLQFQYMLDAMNNECDYLNELMEAGGVIEAILACTSKTDTIKDVMLPRDISNLSITPISSSCDS
nr:U3 small nucleolar RNA-associated protein 15 homolog isoform X2 [Parasteatoda tepidariorum]